MKIDAGYDRGLMREGINYPLSWDVGKYCHALIFGPTGSTKTTNAKLLLGKLALAGCSLIILDYKGFDFSFLRGKCGYFEFTDCGDGIAAAHEILKRRQQGADASKRAVIFWDEVSAYMQVAEKKQVEAARAALFALTALSRAYSMNLFLSMQRPDISAVFGTGAIRDQLSWVCAMGNISQDAASMVGIDRALMLPVDSPGGGHILEDGVRLTPVQFPRVNNINKLHDTIRKAVELPL